MFAADRRSGRRDFDVSAMCLLGRVGHQPPSNWARTRPADPGAQARDQARPPRPSARYAPGEAWSTSGSTVTTWSRPSTQPTPTRSSPSTATWPNHSCAVRISGRSGWSSTPMSGGAGMEGDPRLRWGASKPPGWCATNCALRAPRTWSQRSTPTKPRPTERRGSQARPGWICGLPPVAQVDVAATPAPPGAHGNP